MGNYFSECKDPIQTLRQVCPLTYFEENYASGVVIKGIGYSTTKLIGEGGCGFVYEGYSNADGQQVALKRYIFSELLQQHKTLEEVSIYREASSSEYIVAYVDSEVVYRHGVALPEMWVVMEYCEGPSLQQYINNRLQSTQPFSFREVIEILGNVIPAIGHLHSMSPPVSHWDIKPDNFVFTCSGRLKLCDFGSASRLYYAPKTPGEIVVAEAELGSKMTLLYRPPESLDLWSKKRVDTKADVWALGVLIYTLIFREMPFEANAMEIMEGTPKCYRVGQDSCPDGFQKLMLIVRCHMLVKDPSERSDIFTVSEELAKITDFLSLSRPLPGFQSTQSPRFM